MDTIPCSTPRGGGGAMNPVLLFAVQKEIQNRQRSIDREEMILERVRQGCLQIRAVSLPLLRQIGTHLRRLREEKALVKRRAAGIRRQISRFFNVAYPELKNSNGDLAWHNAPILHLKTTGRAKRGGGPSFNSGPAVEKHFLVRMGGAQ
jgi:hypothetical protein